MTVVEIWGGDAGDFIGGQLVWSALNALKPAMDSPPHRVDLSRLEHARPYTVTAITALGRLSSASAELVLPATQHVRDFVLRSGIADHFICPEAVDLSRSPRNVPVKHLERVSHTFADEISHAWEREFGGMPAGLRPQLAGHLDELMLNALSHAESPIGCIVAGQVYPSTSCVELAVLDLGQTIRGHLSKSSLYSALSDDAAAIIKATEEGVTGTPAGQLNRLGDPNSGVGLFELRRYCESGGGDFTIVSGRAVVTFGPEHAPIVRPFAGGFPGALVNARFHVRCP